MQWQLVAGSTCCSNTCTHLTTFACVQNKIKINDWSAIQTLFDKLNKQLEKTQKVTMSLGVPRKYVRILVELEDNLATTLADKVGQPFLQDICLLFATSVCTLHLVVTKPSSRV